MTRTANAKRIGVPENITWHIGTAKFMTPRVLAKRPPDVLDLASDGHLPPRERRIEVRWTQEARTLDGDVILIFDVNSRNVFELWRNQPCGAGCACAATVVWRPDVADPEAEFDALVASGLSDHEARGTVWPDHE